MKKFFWVLVFVLFLFSSITWAGVIDAPHNKSQNIGCPNCHSYSLWWAYSPSTTSAATHGALSDAVCQICHGPSGSFVQKNAHSSESMETTIPGEWEWSTNCIDCHNPHFQGQLVWLEADSQLIDDIYLVRGDVGGAESFSTVDNGDGTVSTTFQYINSQALSPWDDPANWSQKTGTDRGLILVLPYDTADNSYEVAEATAQSPGAGTGTITVLGSIDSDMAGSSFGLIYGQLLKKEINQKQVKFFDPETDYIDLQTNEGICQSCHELTKYWRKDGDNADPETGLLHNPDIMCTVCHLTHTGFKPSGGPHLFLGESQACVSCHPSGDILAVHKNDCQNCHTTPPDLADPVDKPLVSQIVRGTCQDCHGAEGHDTEIVHNNRKALLFCASCHVVDSQTAIDSLHKGCETCHLYTGDKLDTDVVANAITDGKGVDGVEITCRTCHTALDKNFHHVGIKAANNECVSCHLSVDHEAMVKDSATPVCIGCHTNTAGTITGIEINLDDPNLHNSCRTCHTFDSNKRGILVDFTNRKGVDGTGELPDGGTVGGSDGGGVCTACHTGNAEAYHHIKPQVAVGQCEHCHRDPRIDGTHEPGDNGSDSPYPTQLLCVSCHVRFVDGDMTILKYTRTDYNDLSTPWTVTTQHTIPGVTQAQINNYGMCFSCHGAGTATKVRVFHARPDQHDTGNAWGLGTKNWRRRRVPLGLGQADYAAGRGSSGIGYINYYSSSYENMRNLSQSERPPNIGDFLQDWYDHYTSPRNWLYPYKSTRWVFPWTRSIPASPLNNYSSGVVPLLEAVTSQTAVSPIEDNVRVEHAVFDGTDLIVIATNTDGCSVLTASYGDTDLPMSGGPYCTATFSGANYPADGLTVDVTTANADGVSVNGYPVTDQPGAVAVNDFLSFFGNLPETLHLMSNDIGQGLVLQSVGAASHGDVVISGNTVIYTAEAGFAGSDSFSYVIEDSNGITSEGRVYVTVAINQAPVAVADFYTLAAGSPEASFSVLDNDTDIEGDPLTLISITQPSVGSAVLSDNSILYTPPASGYDGDVIFTYQISDGMVNTATGEVTVTVATPRSWVTVLDAWQPDTPQEPVQQHWYQDGYHHVKTVPDFTISRGLNRLLLVSVTVRSSYAAPVDRELVIVTYGGKTLTKAYSIETPEINPYFSFYRTYFGYLTEDEINSMEGNELDVATPTSYMAVTASFASYSNVNQSMPIAASSGSSYVIPMSYPVVASADAPISVLAGQYAMYNKAAMYCDSTASNNEGYVENIDYIDSVSMYKVGLASRLFITDGLTNPLVTDGECQGNGASSFIVLNNTSSSSATVDTDLDGVGELQDLCPETTIWEQVDTNGCAASQTPEPTNISFSSATYSVAENRNYATITVSRTYGLDAISVNYATTDTGTAIPGEDYEVTSGTLTWDALDMSLKTFTIPLGVYTGEYNADETVGLELSDPVGVTAALGAQDTAMLTIANIDPEPAVISFKDGTTANVAENIGVATIIVSRTGSSSGPVDVDYSTSDGSADMDVHYLSTSGTLHWDDGDMADKSFDVTILDNNIYSHGMNYYVRIELSNPSSGVVLGSYSWKPWTLYMQSLYIIDDDIPSLVNFSSATYSINEDDPAGSATITLQRTGDSNGEVWAYGETTIDQLEPEYHWFTIYWADGDMVDKTFEVPIVNDDLYAPDKTIPMLIYFASNAELGTPSSATLTIVNDDPVPPNTVVLSAANYSVTENSGTATITVSRTGDSSGEVSVDYATTSSGTATPGIDFTATSGTLTWADGDMEDKTFDIPIVDNLEYDGDKTVSLALSSPTGGTLILGDPNTAMLTIVNDDSALVFSAADYSVVEDEGIATITVSRLGSSVGAVGVSYATTSGGTAAPDVDYTATSGTLTWADGDMSDKSFTVSVIDNAVSTGEQTVNLALNSPVGSAVLGDRNTSVLTIADNDILIFLSDSSYSVNEGDGVANITVSIRGNLTGLARVSLWPMFTGTAIYGEDYGDPGSSAFILWLAGDTADKIVTIPIIDDSLPEGNEIEEFQLFMDGTFANVSLGTSSAILTIIDND